MSGDDNYEDYDLGEIEVDRDDYENCWRDDNDYDVESDEEEDSNTEYSPSEEGDGSSGMNWATPIPTLISTPISVPTRRRTHPGHPLRP